MRVLTSCQPFLERRKLLARALRLTAMIMGLSILTMFAGRADPVQQTSIHNPIHNPIHSPIQSPIQNEPAPLPRIISASLCADYYLLAFAAPTQIVALSALSEQEDLFLFPEAASAYPKFDGRLENLARLEADLVIVSAYTPKSRRDMMEKLGFRLFVMDGAQTLAQTRIEAQRLGQAIGRSHQIETWLHQLEQILEDLPRPSRPLQIISYDRRGVSAGDGHMLDNMIRLLGHKNGARRMTHDSSPIPLEKLLRQSPELVILSGHHAYADRGSEILDHPAFRQAIPPARRLEISERWIHCAGPSLIPALSHIVSKISEKYDVYSAKAVEELVATSELSFPPTGN